MVYKEYKMGPYNLHTIKTNKFKLCHMEIIFRNNVVKEEISKRNILFDYLTDSSKRYPTVRETFLKLEDLYNASIYSVTSKVGNTILTNVCMDFINPKYTDKEILEESLKLSFEMLLNPLAVNEEFNQEHLEIVKNRNIANIKSLKENPKKYAITETMKTLGDNSKSSFTNIGSLEEVESITPVSLYKYYKQVLKHDYIDIYIIGDLNMDDIERIISKYAKFKYIKNHDIKMYTSNPKRKPLIKSERFIYVQTNIVMILNLNNLTSYEQKYVANLYNIILGGGSLETKLYKRLREENSLCYNVNSMYQKYDGLIIISTAVDINAKDKAINLIKQAIKDMNNNISDEELERAKELIVSSLGMSMDNIGKIVDNYFFKNVSDLDDYEIRIKEFKKVTKEEIYNLGKKISISTIYSLVGGETN
ncbi:MAG: insulinase family protein [Bacilli bacterium]|nr:insulinase family protein [Bacilli bacterium]